MEGIKRRCVRSLDICYKLDSVCARFDVEQATEEEIVAAATTIEFSDADRPDSAFDGENRLD